MIDPRQAEAMRQLMAGMGSAAGQTAEFDERVRQAKLTFKATIKAMQSGCECESCGLLRQALDVMMEEDAGKVESHAASVSPQPPANRPVS